MIAFTFASVTVAVEVQSTGAVVPVPVTKPVVPLLDAIEVWFEDIHDSSEADTRATAVPPAPVEAMPLFWLAAASMSRFIWRPYFTSWKASSLARPAGFIACALPVTWKAYCGISVKLKILLVGTTDVLVGLLPSTAWLEADSGGDFVDLPLVLHMLGDFPSAAELKKGVSVGEMR
jgi:hypothetical protein